MKPALSRPKNVIPFVPPLERRSLNPEESFASLFDLADSSDCLVGHWIGEFTAAGVEYHIPRFIFMGPRGGGETIRIGLFAGLNGQQKQTGEALRMLLENLEAQPDLARGYHVYTYPLCDPAGTDASRGYGAVRPPLHSQFWAKSKAPEVYFLEREMGIHRFNGVISLHGGDQPVFVGAVQSSILQDSVLNQALHEANEHLPGRAKAGLIQWRSPSVPFFLSRTSQLPTKPFEIVLEIPQSAPAPSQTYGTVSAIKTILSSYRAMLALQSNL